MAQEPGWFMLQERRAPSAVERLRGEADALVARVSPNRPDRPLPSRQALLGLGAGALVLTVVLVTVARRPRGVGRPLRHLLWR